MVVALEIDLDACQVGERAAGFVAAHGELVGGVGRHPGELLGASELAVEGRGDGGDARGTNQVGDRTAELVGEDSLDAGERLGGLSGLEVCACARNVEVRERASVGLGVADRLRCGAQAGDGLQRLSAVLMVLSKGHLDQRRELAVRPRMGLPNPLQPGWSVIAVAECHQLDQQLHHPRRVGLDHLRAELVQPQADRTDGEVRAVRPARRATEGGSHDPAGAVRVGHRQRLSQRAEVIPAILERSTCPLVRGPEIGGA